MTKELNVYRDWLGIKETARPLNHYQLLRLKPFEDIDIAFTGLRPGEKLFEELETTGEHMAKTRHPKIFIGRLASYSPEKLERGLRELMKLLLEGKDDEIWPLVSNLIPESNLERLTKSREPDEEKLQISPIPARRTEVPTPMQGASEAQDSWKEMARKPATSNLATK